MKGAKLMTSKELEQLRVLKLEVKHISKEIEKLNNMKSGTPELKESIEDLESKLICNKQKAQKQIESIECYINNITDAETKRIFQERIINNLTWEQMENIFYMNRKAIKKQFDEYLKSN